MTLAALGGFYYMALQTGNDPDQTTTLSNRMEDRRKEQNLEQRVNVLERRLDQMDREKEQLRRKERLTQLTEGIRLMTHIEPNIEPNVNRVDPRICCAAGVCCDPPGARQATIEILTLAGCDPKNVESIADWLSANKIVLFDANVAESIRVMIEHG